MPKTHTRVMIIPEIIAITAPVTSVMSLIVSPASANNPTIISFHINAMINPKAAAIAVDMLIFTSLNLTILSLASLNLLLHISSLLLRLPIFSSIFLTPHNSTVPHFDFEFKVEKTNNLRSKINFKTKLRK